MYYQTGKNIGKIQELNSQMKLRASNENDPKKFKLRALKTNAGLGNITRKNYLLNQPNKRKSMLVDLTTGKGKVTPQRERSPLQQTPTMRIRSSTNKPRKSQVYHTQMSFFGSPKEPLKYNTPLGELAEVQSNDESNANLSTMRGKIATQRTIKPEVTISEYDISRKWYEYEQKMFKDHKLPPGLFSKSTYSSTKGGFSFSLNDTGAIIGNLKSPKKTSGALNPLVGSSSKKIRNITFDEKMYEDEPKFVRPKPAKTTLISIKQYEFNRKFIIQTK